MHIQCNIRRTARYQGHFQVKLGSVLLRFQGSTMGSVANYFSFCNVDVVGDG